MLSADNPNGNFKLYIRITYILMGLHESVGKTYKNRQNKDRSENNRVKYSLAPLRFSNMVESFRYENKMTWIYDGLSI